MYTHVHTHCPHLTIQYKTGMLSDTDGNLLDRSSLCILPSLLYEAFDDLPSLVPVTDIMGHVKLLISVTVTLALWQTWQ